MAELVRQATVRWLSHPPEGHARISVHSRAFTALVMSLTEEAEPHPGQVTPGELLAAGFAACLAADLAELLRDRGHPANELTIDGEVIFTGGVTELSHQLVSLRFRVRARVTGLDERGFATVADEALRHFRATKGVRADLAVTIDAKLIGGRPAMSGADRDPAAG